MNEKKPIREVFAVRIEMVCLISNIEHVFVTFVLLSAEYAKKCAANYSMLIRRRYHAEYNFQHFYPTDEKMFSLKTPAHVE